MLVGRYNSLLNYEHCYPISHILINIKTQVINTKDAVTKTAGCWQLNGNYIFCPDFYSNSKFL